MRSLDQRALDRARRAVLGRDPGHLPLCTAPSTSLFVARDGVVGACESAHRAVLADAGDDLRAAFADPAIAALRGNLERGELPPDHCAGCARLIELGCVLQSRPVRDHATRVPSAGTRGPVHLLIAVPDATAGDASDGGLERLVTRLRSVADSLAELELEVADPSRSRPLEALLAAWRERPPGGRPALALRITSIADPDAAARVLADAAPLRIRLTPGPDLAEQMRWCRRTAPAAAIDVDFLLTPDNWFDVHPVASRCAEHGANLRLLATDARGAAPVEALAIAERRALSGLLGSFWYLFADAARPSSLAPDAYDLLREEVRRVSAQGERSAAVGPARLGLPAPDHPLLRDPRLGATLLRGALGLAETGTLATWAERWLADPRLAGLARQRPWLRLLAQSATVARPSADLFSALAAMYATGGEALLEQDRAFADEHGLADAVARWRDWLGLDRLGTRTPPFRIAAARAPKAAREPDLTVLVPSYRHGRYIEDCLRSVLAQSYTDFVVHVVDDASPDDTVERARAIADERVTVRVNDANRGLGNSVLEALAHVTTPFVALLNSDDVFHPERLQRCRRVLAKDPQAQVVATGLSTIDRDGGELTPANTSRVRDGLMVYDWVHWYASAQPQDPSHDDLFARLLEHNFLATSSNLVCRTDFLRAEADALRSLEFCLDWHVFLAAARSGGLRYLPEPLAGYRLHPSNTVWFREGRRWRYFLEVNRVAAGALRRHLDAAGADANGQGAALRVLELAASHLTRNTEVHGYAAYLNELIGGLELERLASGDPAAAACVQALDARAERMTRLYYAARDLADADLATHLREIGRLDELEALRSIEPLLREDAHVAREALLWAREHIEHVERDLRGARARGDELRASAERLDRLLAERVADLAHAADRIGVLADRLARLVPGAEHAAGDDAAPAQRRVIDQLRRLSRATDDVTRVLASERHQRVAANERLASVERERADAAARLADLTARHATLAEQHRELERTRDRLDRRRIELRAELDGARRQAADELAALRRSREWRLGNALWNKIPLFGKSRRLLRRTWNRSREFAGRSSMVFRRLFTRRKPASIKIAAGSTAHFPIISHTFVYQELMGFHEMLGAEVKLLHSQDGDAAALHEAFRYLDLHRTRFVSSWDVHVADFEHYRKTRPDRVESLLAALSAASGMPRAELEKRYELMLAFTHARRVEAWGADYVHTYFFYDQALNGLVSSWLLDVPRGLSTYADHMMSDWPLKVVALHLRTADVIVATSRRIRDELIGIGGPGIADRVVVKPNGVDGRRFPAVARTPVAGRALELVCVSRIEPKKGMLELVETVHLLRGSGRALRVHVIGGADAGCKGSNDYAAAFERRIAELGLGDVIVRHGSKRQEQIVPLLGAADAFVAPFVETESGDKDGIPTAILEAMATGLPIVATDAGSIPEILDDGVEGFLVPQRDPQALADAIARLIADPGLAPRLGKAARARFDREFDIRATEPRLHERVRAAIKRGRSAAAV